MAIEQTDPPTQGADEPFAQFAERYRVWWQGEDIRLRREGVTNWAEMMAKVDAVSAPTAAAWTVFDGRLAALADALNAGHAQSGNFDLAFLKWLLPLVMRMPDPPQI